MNKQENTSFGCILFNDTHILPEETIDKTSEERKHVSQKIIMAERTRACVSERGTKQPVTDKNM
jgi:hypothetical protein